MLRINCFLKGLAAFHQILTKNSCIAVMLYQNNDTKEANASTNVLLSLKIY
jgi:hypothetical protein